MIGKRGNQKGFTLIELLVVIGIMGVLAAVAVPAYSKFFGAGKTEANSTELVAVQSAMDAMMATKAISTIAAANTTATATFATLPSDATAEPLSPSYLRTIPTACLYSWTITGLVTQTSC